MDIAEIAEICHEANRALQRIQADPTIPVSKEWLAESLEQRQSVMNGVAQIVSGEVETPEQSHENWCRFKQEQGWIFGPVKSEKRKEHPLLIPYDQLPHAARTKDALFFAIIKALADR